MKKGKKEISTSFSQTFGKNGSHVKSIRVDADNNREPMICFSSTAERLSTDDLRMLGIFLNNVADEIEADDDFKNK